MKREPTDMMEYAEEWAKGESYRQGFTQIQDGRYWTHGKTLPASAQCFQFSRVSDLSDFGAQMPGINLGHPAIARFAARWLNAALDFWRNW